ASANASSASWKRADWSSLWPRIALARDLSGLLLVRCSSARAARSSASAREPSRRASSASTRSTDGGGEEGHERTRFAKEPSVAIWPLRASGLKLCSNTGSTSSLHEKRKTSSNAQSQCRFEVRYLTASWM